MCLTSRNTLRGSYTRSSDYQKILNRSEGRLSASAGVAEQRVVLAQGLAVVFFPLGFCLPSFFSL